MAKCPLTLILPDRKPGSPLRGPVEQARRILREHAPEVAALQHGATWSAEVQAAVKRAIDALPESAEFRAHVQANVAHVLTAGRERGLWDHEPWPAPTRIPLAKDRLLGKGDQQRIDRVDADRENFLAKLPELLGCVDPAVARGAALFSAALTGGLIRTDFLRQLLAQEIQHYKGLHWLDLKLGKPGSVWKSPRRWFVDPVTLALLKQVPGDGVDTEKALRAFTDWLRIEPYSCADLAQAGKAWWRVRLPGFFFEYAVRPDLGLSLAPKRFRRVVTDAPLPRAVEQELRKQRTPDDWVHECQPSSGVTRLDLAPATRNGHAEQAALSALKELLRKPQRHPEPTLQVLERRLADWRDSNHDAGGWVWLLQAWVAETLKQNSNRDARVLKRPGLLRYLTGFAKLFIHVMRDVPPHLVSDSTQAVHDRMEALAMALGKAPSAHVTRRALSQFLRYVHEHTGVHVPLTSEWEAVAAPSQAVANLVTPGEMDRLLEALGQILPVETLPGLRVQVMAQLAFCTGLRWELLHTMRLKNIFMGDKEALGVLMLRRRNLYVRGKTKPTGGVALEQVMPPRWLAMFRQYVTRVREAAGPQADFLFADPATPHLPPADELTRTLVVDTLREVTGDPGLRFHDLRHGAANAAFVAIHWPADPAPKVVEHLRPFSAQARGLLPEGESYLQLVTQRTQDDRAGMYAVSSLLDHWAPETTTKSYLHVVDALFAAKVLEHLALPADTQALLDGVGTEAIRKRKYRARTKPKKGTTRKNKGARNA